MHPFQKNIVLSVSFKAISFSLQLKARIQELEKTNRELLSKLNKLSDSDEKMNVCGSN